MKMINYIFPTSSTTSMWYQIYLICSLIQKVTTEKKGKINQ